MDTLQLNSRDSAVIDAVMTLFKSASKETQTTLWIKINSAMSGKDAKNHMSHEDISSFLDSLVVKGGKPVPADESGLNAFIEEKYKL